MQRRKLMSEKKFLNQSIEKKEKRLSRVMLESIGFTGIIGALAGYVFSVAYTGCMVDGTALQIIIVAIAIAAGITIGYFDGRSKQEELKTDLMVLHDLNNRL
jgi:hypothetical protein